MAAAELEYRAAEALTILGARHVNKRSFDRFERLAPDMRSGHWERITRWKRPRPRVCVCTISLRWWHSPRSSCLVAKGSMAFSLGFDPLARHITMGVLATTTPPVLGMTFFSTKGRLHDPVHHFARRWSLPVPAGRFPLPFPAHVPKMSGRQSALSRGGMSTAKSTPSRSKGESDLIVRARSGYKAHSPAATMTG